MHKTNKRQSEILKLLKTKKHITTKDIAAILGVTTRTIRNDLLFLRKEFHQIEIKRGSHDGGIYWHDR